VPWICSIVELRVISMALSSALIFFSFASTTTRSASSSAAIRRWVFPAMSRGRTVASIAFACNADRFFLRCPGNSGLRIRWPVDGLDPKVAQLVTAVGEHSQKSLVTVS